MISFVITICALFALSSSQFLTKQQWKSTEPLHNFTSCFAPSDDESIFKFSIPQLNKSLPDIEFSKFKGKVILLVNVATYCRSPIEYPLLNKLKEQFKDDLEIVAFPESQFLNQEPGSTPEEILNAIHFVRPGNGFVPKFLLTQKIAVNGPDEHEIYSFLKRSCPSPRLSFYPKEDVLYDPKNDRDIRWNFERFLINPHTGLPVYRYDWRYTSDHIAPHIKELLKK